MNFKILIILWIGSKLECDCQPGFWLQILPQLNQVKPGLTCPSWFSCLAIKDNLSCLPFQPHRNHRGQVRRWPTWKRIVWKDQQKVWQTRQNGFTSNLSGAGANQLTWLDANREDPPGQLYPIIFQFSRCSVKTVRRLSCCSHYLLCTLWKLDTAASRN